MAYYNRLDLEMDDWLDPTMPRMYHVVPGAVREFVIGGDFTSESEAFVRTGLMPAFTPVLTEREMALVLNG